MKIYIGTDHRGVELEKKLVEYLSSKDIEVIGTKLEHSDTDDYVDFAKEVCDNVVKDKGSIGILICRTGIGMSIAANKVKGVRCARVIDEYDAKMTRIDNDANVIALSSRIDIEKLKILLKVFLETPHNSEERHDRRISKIDNYER